MRIAVPGAAGMLGGAVLRAATGHDVTPFTRAELDVTDAAACDELLGGFDAVINCTAWADVDGAEEREDEATAVNGAGAGNLARAATRHGAHLVHVSTDYVFDGAKREPWLESDGVGPLGAYGRSKLAGEREVLATGDHAVVRTAWLFGSGGGNFVDTMLRLGGERDEVSVVTDQVGSPTWTGHLAPVLVAIAEGRVGGILHRGGTGAVSWHGLTVEAFAQAGVDCAIGETTAASFARPAPRPAYSVLGTERTDAPLLPDWREGLAGHLAARSAT